MKIRSLKSLALGAVACGATSTALFGGSFDKMSSHLDLDGDFLAFMDFDGDGQALGEKLNVIYQQAVELNPEMPPIPIDFPALFDTLGFGSIRSIGMSSAEVDEGVFRNLSVTLLEGEPAGLFGLYDLTPSSFRAAAFAPADSTSAFSGSVDFGALADTVGALAIQIMGPMGEGMVAQGMMQPIAGTDLTATDLVEAFSGEFDMVMRQTFTDMKQPVPDMWLSFNKAGILIPRLEPMLEQMGIQFLDTGDSKVADLSALMEGAPFGLFVELPNDSDALVLYTDAAWVDGFGSGETLADTEDFKSLVGRLPEDAAMYAYSTGFDADQLLALLEQNPATAMYAPIAKNAVDLLLGGLLAPAASATYLDGEALVTEGYAGYSYKGMLMAVPAGVGAAVGAGMAAEKMSKAPEPPAGE